MIAHFCVALDVKQLMPKGQCRLSREIAKRTALPKDESAPDNALVVWLRLQRSLADKNGVALVTLSQDGAAIGRIENDNSICKALRVAPDYAPLCQADCGGAHDRALTGGERIEYTCHAGLHCFAMPVSIGKRQLVILGGRAFTSTAEYMRFQRNYNDLPAVRSGECLKKKPAWKLAGANFLNPITDWKLYSSSCKSW